MSCIVFILDILVSQIELKHRVFSAEEKLFGFECQQLQCYKENVS